VLLVLGAIGAVLALALEFFVGRQEALGDGPGLPVYTLDQTASTHAGFRRTTLARGNDIYVSDYEDAALRLVTSEPKPAIGRYVIGTGYVCAIPGQPTTAYIAGDVGSEMPAYEPFRNIKKLPFDWRTATFRKMTASKQYKFGPLVTTTNAALMAEVVRVLREGTPVELNPFPFSGATNLTTLNLTCDQLPGMLFCPALCYYSDGNIYLAQSLMPDLSVTPPQVRARWIPASPLLTEWL